MRFGPKGVVALALRIASVGILATVPAAIATAAPARIQTSNFAVSNMTCATCPIAVKTAMGRVAGVKQVKVDFEAKIASVTYDPSTATPAMIAMASTNIGFPARQVAQ
jgi:mercuric ion binding protein